QDLDVAHDEARLFDCWKDLRERGNVASREDVLADEGGSGRGRTGPPDRVKKHDAVRLQQRCAFLEEGSVMVDADVLEHADRYDSVKALGEIPVILMLEMDAAARSQRLGAFDGRCVLLRGQGDA